jgi:hypothetical protein
MDERFWSKVDRSGGDEACWVWLASKMKNNYGRFRMRGRTSTTAHRIAWELTNGAIPDGLLVRHKCRGKCVNPAHLELGTHTDNARDRMRMEPMLVVSGLDTRN